jgi:hypothetical protein
MDFVATATKAIAIAIAIAVCDRRAWVAGLFDCE